MVNRTLKSEFDKGLKTYPIVALTGPRQSGKTIFLRESYPEYKYISLENPDMRRYSLDDPNGFLEEYSDKVILDEVQHVPHLFSYIQTKTDNDQIMGQYILSGSQNFNLMENISQSLAGRVAIYRLFPFDFEELDKAGLLEKTPDQSMTKGFYPAIYDRDINPDKFYSDYLTTYVKRDVMELKNIQNQRNFTTFIKLCASRAGQLVNYNDLARDAGISHTTAKEWLSLLETSYIIFFLTPYHKNYSKRLIKSPKMYFYDTGLLCHLLGIRGGELSPTYPQYGHIFENMIVAEAFKQVAHRDRMHDFYFWRDSHGHEIDLLYTVNNKMHIYEIKSSKTINASYLKGLDYFEKISQEANIEKILVYAGNKKQQRTHHTIYTWDKAVY